jgi:hypothetical protein
MIGKHKGRWAVKHCSGKNKGKPIKGGVHKTKAGAQSQHRAIQASKARRR